MTYLVYQDMRVTVAALQLDRRYIEFESDPTYYHAGKHRLDAALASKWVTSFEVYDGLAIFTPKTNSMHETSTI